VVSEHFLGLVVRTPAIVSFSLTLDEENWESKITLSVEEAYHISNGRTDVGNELDERCYHDYELNLKTLVLSIEN
jgi:hypothetical protein